MKSSRILIADYHPILRHGLKDILGFYKDFSVVAEAGDGKSLVENYNIIKPDIVITDIEMPILKGTEAAVSILKTNPFAKIIFLSMHNSNEILYKSFLIGASGFLSKDISKEELIHAIRIIAQGDKYFLGKINFQIDTFIKQYKSLKNQSMAVLSVNLTNREKSILLLMANGLTSFEIGLNLGIGKRTVDSIRSEMMKKLYFEKPIQLVKYALEYSFNYKNYYSDNKYASYHS